MAKFSDVNDDDYDEEFFNERAERHEHEEEEISASLEDIEEVWGENVY